MNLEAVFADTLQRIEKTHRAREQALSSARLLIRQCANTIRAIHRGEFDQADRLLQEAATNAAQIRASLAEYPDILFAGYTQDALKELAEAALVYAFLRDQPPPGPVELGVDPAAYLNGLAEAASEVRRAILDDLRAGRTDRTERLLRVMDDVYSLLVTVDYPDAVTGGLRRTTDALRAVLERTRGDVTNALRQEQLVAAIRFFEQELSSQRSRLERQHSPESE